MDPSKVTSGNSQQLSSRGCSSCYRSSSFFAQTFDAAAIKVKSQIALENAEASTAYHARMAKSRAACHSGAASMDIVNAERKPGTKRLRLERIASAEE